MIGIFDSGIGGVTVFKEILNRLPKQDYIYYSDSKNNPYGDLPRAKIQKIVNDVAKYLIKQNCQIIVIACNTASTVCVNKLRKNYPNITFIATEPAYKMAHDYAYNKKTLVMATTGTIKSEKFLNLYHKYDNHKTILLECPGLAEIIENEDIKKINEYLKKHLGKYKDIKNVVLGCTHYPLIKDDISNVLGQVTFFDGAIGISKELERKVKELGVKGTGKIIFVDSNGNKEKEKRFKKILNSF